MTRRMRRDALCALAAIVAVALSACAGLPSSGPVDKGLPVSQDTDPADVSFLPDEPQPGATPQEIVGGFLRAGSGPANSWEVARLYLAGSFRDEWKPEASVTVDVLADRTPTVTSDTTIDVQVTPTAAVDDAGAYTDVERTPRTLAFTLAQDDNDQWRITQAPNGVVLDEDLFPRVYNAYPLTYFDPAFQYLVPDVRWFPRTKAATRIALALVDGAPSTLLADSVATAFPGDVSLQGPSVPIEGAVAQVVLNPAALASDQTTRNRMYTQLVTSLRNAGVTDVRMVASGTELDAQLVPTRPTRVDASALGLTEAGFGYLSGTDLAPVDGVTDAMKTVQPAPVGIQLAASRQFAAVRVADGTVVRVQADGQVLSLDTRANLIDPSLDPQGYVWSVPSDAPTALAAFSAQSERIDVQSAWAAASRITAMEVSRDGTRIVAVVTNAGNSVAWVAGIVRDTKGVPQRLGDPVPLATLSGAGLDIGWVGDSTVGVLARSGADVSLVLQPVGGPATEFTAPTDTTSLAGGTIPSGVRLRDSAGALYLRRGSSWQQTNTGVLVLATQAGLPQ